MNENDNDLKQEFRSIHSYLHQIRVYSDSADRSIDALDKRTEATMVETGLLAERLENLATNVNTQFERHLKKFDVLGPIIKDQQEVIKELSEQLNKTNLLLAELAWEVAIIKEAEKNG